jgi:hypothetical protein
MASRLAALLPRFVLVGIVCLLGTVAAAFAADKTISGTPATQALATTSAQPSTLVVPDVQHQAYVFAKGTLDDAGFAWRVVGSVQGYAANVVASQTPAPGTAVVDTGAPTIVLRLARNPKYAEHGAPENGSSFAGTPIELVGATPAQAPKPAATAAKPAAGTPALKPPAVKAAAKPSAPKPSAAKPAAAKRSSAAAKKAAAAARYPQRRPTAFTVAGAAKEPLDEMPLPDRARLLGTWLSTHRRPTNANVHHWLFQHAWIVQGARFGWWRGDDALKILIADDEHAQRVWGIGGRSATVARRALAEVQARSR